MPTNFDRYPILAGLTCFDASALKEQFPEFEFWDGLRERVSSLSDDEEDFLVMSLYHLVEQHGERIRWINGVITYSWIDAALFLESRYPSYVDNFCIHFRSAFSPYRHCAFYESEAEALRFNRVLPGIKLFKRDEMKTAMEKLLC